MGIMQMPAVRPAMLTASDRLGSATPRARFSSRAMLGTMGFIDRANSQ